MTSKTKLTSYKPGKRTSFLLVFKYLSQSQRRGFLIAFVYLTGISLLEIIGVGAFIPVILGILGGDTSAAQNVYPKWFSEYGLNLQNLGLSKITLLFLSVYTTKTLLIAILNWFLYRYIFNLRTEISTDIFERSLNEEWLTHLKHESVLLMRTLTAGVAALTGYLLVVLKLISEFTIIIGIIGVLAIVSLKLVLIFVLVGLVSSKIFSSIVSPRVQRLSAAYNRDERRRLSWLKASLDSFRLITLTSRRFPIIRTYSNLNSSTNVNSMWLNFIQQMPRLYFETVLVFLVATAILVLSKSGLESKEIAVMLSIYSFAALRLVPSISRISTFRQQIEAQRPLIDDFFQYSNCIRQSEVTPSGRRAGILSEPLNIRFEGVSFRYPNTRVGALSDVTFNIPFGSTVLLRGQSGAGKTTVVNMLTGLLLPLSGNITVGGANIGLVRQHWREIVSYVPQEIPIVDGTLRENLLFGLADKPDQEFLERAIYVSGLEALVRTSPEGLEMNVGENGRRISGGQRQRLGIARALLLGARILVLDEATSALDYSAEQEILARLKENNERRTLILVSHRNHDKAYFDLVLQIDGGQIKLMSD